MRALSALFVLLIGTSTGAAAAFDGREWKHRRLLTVPPGGEYAEVVMDGPLYQHAAPGFRDVRIVSEDGRPIPYVLRTWAGRTTERTVRATILNRSVRPGTTSQLELDTGGRHAHDRLELEVDAAEFTRRIVLEGSADGRSWLMLKRATIARDPGSGVEVTAIAYPPATYQYLRLTIHDQGEAPLTVRKATLLFTQRIPPTWEEWFSGPVSARAADGGRRTVIRIDAGQPVPLSRAELTIAGPSAFVRDLRVEASIEGETWTFATQSHLVRMKGTPERMPIVIEFPETYGRYLRLTIENGDDPPLQVRSAAVSGLRRTILFPSMGGTYWLYVGNLRAQTPQYDLPEVLDLNAEPPRAVTVAGGPLERNPAYAPPVLRRSWTEDRPWLLWALLAASILILGLLIAQTVRGLGSRSDR